MTFELEHWHYDVFRAGAGPAEGTKLEFLASVNGDVDRVSIPLEPAVTRSCSGKGAPEGDVRPRLSRPRSWASTTSWG